METYMQKALTDDMLHQAATLYGVMVDDIQKIGGFENFVFEFKKDNKEYILRFVHSGHRSFQQVLAEIEFVDYLDANNAKVSTVIHSCNNKIVEQITINETDYFSVSVFTKAPGDFIKPKEQTAEFFTMFGREVGKLHRLTKTYKPLHKRDHWYQENFYALAVKHLPEDTEIHKIYLALEKRLKALPITTDTYGLIHTDLHFHNMYYHEGDITFFDFDDAAYMHFISDIAIIIYYYFRQIDNRDPSYNITVRWILSNLLKGYRKENNIDTEFLQNLNDFLLLRSIVLYIVLAAAGFLTHEDKRRREYAMMHRDRVVQDLMSIDLDYVLKDL